MDVERDEAASYDDVPYPSHAFSRTAPDRLAVVGRVFGVPTAPPDAARVLEIGCASGGNLLPLAAANPRGTYVGVDLSPRQIEAGERIRAELGLTNATLIAVDVTTWQPEPGAFDYVICHGVYAWVGDDVRAAILATVARALAPGGVGCVSTNVSPGWRMLGGVRDALTTLQRPGDDRERQAAHARHVLDVLATGLAHSGTPWARLVREVRGHAEITTESYLLHEYLDAHHRPAPLSTIASELREAGLRYLGDTAFAEMLPHLAPPPVRDRLAALASDVVSTEQGLDWIRGRSFRHVLMVRGDEAVQRDLGRFDATGFFVASRATALPDVNVPGRYGWWPTDDTSGPPVWTTDVPWMFTLLDGARRAWPVPVSFEDLVAPVLEEIGVTDELRAPWRARLGQLVLYAHGLGLLELHRCPLSPVACAGDRPVGWSWARAELRRRASATTLRHESVALHPVAAEVLLLCDGTRDRGDITAALADVVRRRARLTDEEPVAPSRDDVDRVLQWLQDASLVVA